jgi:hypothetical protein
MTKKHCDVLICVLARQSAECAKLSAEADAKGDNVGKSFQAGASLALARAVEYVKDAQAGILYE